MPQREDGGEIDFSERELLEMNAEVSGRRADETPRPRRKSMLRVPVDQVPRLRPPAFTPDASGPLFLPDPADDVVEHAFSNGGQAEAVIAARLKLIVLDRADPAGTALGGAVR